MPRDLEADLRATLHDRAGEYRPGPDVLDRIDATITRHERHRHRRAVALAAAALAVIVATGLTLLAGRSGTPERRVQTLERPSQLAGDGGLPPWVGNHVPTAAAPAPLVASWNANPLRNECPMLTFTDLGVGHGATVRIPQWAEPSWAVAYDKPGLNGGDGSANGRSAFGLAAISLYNGPNLAGGPLTVQRILGPRPPTVSWSDGSGALIMGSGQEWTASLAIAGYACQYQLWTHNGEQLLDALIDGLRFVGEPPAPTLAVTPVPAPRVG